MTAEDARARERQLCRVCAGNGVVQIRGGISTCDHCRGDCWEPADETITRLRAEADQLRAALRRAQGTEAAIQQVIQDARNETADPLRLWRFVHPRDAINAVLNKLEAALLSVETPAERT